MNKIRYCDVKLSNIIIVLPLLQRVPLSFLIASTLMVKDFPVQWFYSYISEGMYRNDNGTYTF